MLRACITHASCYNNGWYHPIWISDFNLIQNKTLPGRHLRNATIMTDIIWCIISDFNLISNKTLPGRHLRKIAHFQIQVMSLGKFCHCTLHVCVCEKQYLYFGTSNQMVSFNNVSNEYTWTHHGDLTGPISTTGHDSDTANPAGLNGAGKSQAPRAAPTSGDQWRSGEISRDHWRPRETSTDPWRPRKTSRHP